MGTSYINSSSNRLLFFLLLKGVIIQFISGDLNASRPNSQYRPAMPLGNRKKIILEGLLSSVLTQFKKYNPSGNRKSNNLGIFQTLKLRTLMGKKSFEFLSS